MRSLSRKTDIDGEKSVARILSEHIFTFFNALNFALAACLAAVGSYRNMLFMGVVIANLFIGVIQELRARNTVRRLRILNAPTARVLRGGVETSCAAEALQRGDLTVLRAGDQILADAVVAEGFGAVNESLLTGESESVPKTVNDALLSGSYVTEGRLVARLTRVGSECYAARITREAKRVRSPRSALLRDLNGLIRRIGAVLLPLGALLYCKQRFILHLSVREAITASAAAMLGMIPEGLILLTSVALEVGVIRLGRRNTLVKELYAIESMARTDVLCLDKTGTITSDGMTLTRLIPITGDADGLRREIGRFIGAFDDQSATPNALRASVPIGSETPLAVLPFSSARKKSAATFADGTTLILGAPEFVMDGMPIPDAVRKEADACAESGSRVLLIAKANAPICGSDLPPVAEILGLCVLESEIRANVCSAAAYFRAQGVTIKVLSGDDPRTASAIARKAGIEGWEKRIDASALNEAERCGTADRFTVFGRLSPQQKKELTEALQYKGHSVAMIGDGVNDLPAMRAADTSVAMANGADAARHAAQIVLLDDDFASMPEIVLEGRRVINNITRSAALFLTKTLFSFALTLLTLILPDAYPFQPIQLTLISALTIGFPSFVLALEPDHTPVRADFLPTVLRRAVPGAAAVTLCATLAMLGERFFGWEAAACSTVATLCAGFAGLCTLFNVCRPFNQLRAALIAAMTAAFYGAAFLFGKLFILTRLNAAQITFLIALMALCIPIICVFGAKKQRPDDR